MSIKLHILANDGSPLGVTEASVFGEDGRTGVGGSELCLMTLCRAWHERGYDITLYNDPDNPEASVFEQKAIAQFDPNEDRDVLIVWRSPNHRVMGAKGLKVWVSHDQHTIGDFRAFAPSVDKIVVISEHHAQHFKNVYGIHNTTVIDIPIRIWEYEETEVEKIPYQCIFNHMPDRGVMELRPVWAEVVRDFPEATLVITSDWRLWSKWASVDAIQKYKISWASLPNVTYLGAVNRRDLIRYQLSSELELYPSVYEELFGIATAENQVAGCYPITSAVGATATTNMGTVIPGRVDTPEWNRKFIDTALEFLDNRDKLQTEAKRVQMKAKERFSLERILKEWDDVFNE